MWLPILDFLRTAGDYALAAQKDAALSGTLKDEYIYSIVTKADFGVSKMFEEFVGKTFADQDCVIIDEESIIKQTGDVFEYMKSKKHQLVIDPIDGTLVYASGVPTWGILVGVFENLKPIAGFIYLPALGELAYVVNNKAYYIQNAFKENQTQSLLLPKEKTPFVYLLHPMQYQMSPESVYGKMLTYDLYSQAANYLYTLKGSVRANICRCCLWDVAAVMAFAEPLGFVFKNYQTNENIQSINSSWLNDKLSLTADVVLSRPQDFAELKNIVTPKKNAI